MLDEFVLFGKVPADPWHRMSCCNKPVFLFIEFCQIVGPKPLYFFPKPVGPHLDLDQVALWVMSCENTHASLTCTYNPQLGLYALVQHSTILDLSARAFQRPFALVLLQNDKPDWKFIQLFHEKCIELIRPFLSCNRQHFQYLMQHLIHFADNIESENFNNYYTILSTNMNLPPRSNLIRGVQIVAQQARKWYNRTLEGKNYYITNPESKCDCGVDPSEFEKFLPLIATHCASMQLIPLLELAPCSGTKILTAFELVYADLVAENVLKGVLFSFGIPILRSFFGANTSFQSETNEESTIAFSETVGSGNKRKTLKAFSTALTNGVFHVLAGDKIAVLASIMKEPIGIDLMNKINSLKVCKRFEKALWHINLERPMTTKSCIAGFLCNFDNSPSWSDSNFPVVIDLNHQRIKCRKYSGKFLQNLCIIDLKSFPSDESILTYLASIFTDIQQYTILAMYTSPRFLVDRLKLSASDQLILFNCLIELNLIKYCFLSADIQKLSNLMPIKNVKL